ncbi:signal peptidase I [Lachnoclostridium phytofermentans]|uniref:Signal peptidase I n=1 Tax=Lachnoclostridium phytofermentans (strain ATCC 700394 / DSM 18823 / ISDg) TaxID=357809 RepID=A9KMM8_LACP7|nr:signal peptidase I [Lachnoclostridium phytofermentans]ABX41473.1 signal peptidase I [Lachnoclostridium phytofermentans ISDg]
MDKQTCILVKELIPLYCDKATSEQSNQIIEEHLKECDSCKVFLDSIMAENEFKKEMGQCSDEVKDDNENYVKIAKRLKKRRRMIITSTFAAVVFIFICITSWFQTFFNIGGMEPTYDFGANFVANKLIYSFRAPKQGEVVVLYYGDNVCMKRIIGIPGDTVDINSGHIYVNNELIDTEYTFGTMQWEGDVNYPIALGEDEYFVLGDNYENSLDSRYQSFGLVPRDNIFGKVMFQTNFSLTRTKVTTAR